MLKELEDKQGTALFPLRVYVHSDNKGFKRLYLLDIFQRIFIFFEDPKASIIGQFIGLGMLSVIVLNLIIFIISSLPTFQTQPETCESPACNDHDVLCPNTVVCEPVEVSWTKEVEVVCVILFTVEYLSRMLLVYHMPPRLADVLMKKPKNNTTMSSIFTTNRPSSKDELFAYVKAVLEETESEGSAFARAAKRTNGEANEDRKALESELLNVSPSSSVVTSGKHTIPTDSRQGSGKFVHVDSAASLARSGTPLEVVDEGEGVELSERVIQALAKNKGAMVYTADGENDGFVLGGMNKPIFSTEEGAPLGDRDNSLENFGRHSRVASTPDASKRTSLSDQLAPRAPYDRLGLEEAAKKKMRERRASRIITHSYNETDGVEDLAVKSLKMDRSHRYSGLFKTFMYGCKVLNVIDLVAILPFYVELIVGSGNGSLSVVRVLRLARVFRIFKMGKGSSGVQMLGKTIWESVPALSLLFFFIVLGVILFGAIVFFLEAGDYKVLQDYPEGAYLIKDFFGAEYIRSTFTSIFAGCYWAVVTTTTTGYGEMVPLTTLGQCVSILCAYYGVLLLALPITVIGNNFDKTLNAQQGRDNEQFIYECLAGITRSLDVEYRARSKLAPVPSSAYKMTLITAIISTFDTTKQTLLKDAISSANREAIANRHKSEQELDGVSDEGDSGSGIMISPSSPDEGGGGGGAASARAENLRRAVEMLEGNDEVDYEPKVASTRTSMDYHQFAAAKRKEAGESGNVIISASEASGAMYPGGVKLAVADIGSVPDSPRRAAGAKAGASMAQGESKDGNNQAPQKMAGITWTNMPSMPRKRASDSRRNKLKYADDGQPIKVSAKQQLEAAQQELQDAIAAWTELLSADQSPRIKNNPAYSSGSDSDDMPGDSD